FCLLCKHSMERTISAIMKGVHHKCTVSVFQWQKHTDSQCKVCEHFSACASGHMKRPKAGTVCQAGISPNTLIAHLQKIASPAAFLQEPNPPLASVNNLSILEELKCAICANVLSQPLELMCSALVCTTCILTESIAASGAVSCTCCSNDGPLLPTHVRPASNAILLLLSD
ncbi:hypothetical protein EMCRGX_G016997, partial [Ephydatia muelleri]